MAGKVNVFIIRLELPDFNRNFGRKIIYPLDKMQVLFLLLVLVFRKQNLQNRKYLVIKIIGEDGLAKKFLFCKFAKQEKSDLAMIPLMGLFRYMRYEMVCGRIYELRAMLGENGCEWFDDGCDPFVIGE